jgi:hypothetical protein
MPKSPAGFGFRTMPLIEGLEERRLLSADLVGSFVGSIPQSLEPQVNNRLIVRLSNTGNQRAVGQAAVSLYASTDQTLDASDTLLATASPRVKLGPRSSQFVFLKFISPVVTADASDFLLVKVDSSAIAAASPAINVASSPSPLPVYTAFSDLAISFGQLPSDPVELNGFSSGNSKAAVVVRNVGNVAVSGSVSVNLYLSSDVALDGSDPLLSAISGVSVKLRPGAVKTFCLNITPPPGTAAGGYFLFATLTSGSSIVDSNAGNNVVMSARRVAVVSQLPRPKVVEISQTTNATVFYDGSICVGSDDNVVVGPTDMDDNSSDSSPPPDNSSSGSDSSSDNSSSSSMDGSSDSTDSSSSSDDDSGSDSSDDSSDRA